MRSLLDDMVWGGRSWINCMVYAFLVDEWISGDTSNGGSSSLIPFQTKLSTLYIPCAELYSPLFMVDIISATRTEGRWRGGIRGKRNKLSRYMFSHIRDLWEGYSPKYESEILIIRSKRSQMGAVFCAHTGRDWAFSLHTTVDLVRVVLDSMRWLTSAVCA